MSRPALPDLPTGIKSRPCLPGEQDTIRVLLDYRGRPVWVQSLVVDRRCCREWVLLGVRQDEGDMLADSSGVPADMFVAGAIGPPLPFGTTRTLELEVLRVAVSPHRWWRRLLGATRLDRLSPLLARLGLARAACALQRLADWRWRPEPGPTTFYACAWWVPVEGAGGYR